MPTWIAFFRGINVGGKNILPMAELRAGLDVIGLANVRTYIQSGNVVFESKVRSVASLSKKIADAVEAGHGFRPDVLVLSADELRAAVDANPYPKAVDDPKSLHLFFLAAKPSKPALTAIDNLKAASESYTLTDRVFYLHAPDGIGKSKLVASAERHLGVAATARNFRSVAKVLEMAVEA